MMVSIVYYDNNQFVYKEGIVTGTDFEYKKEIRIVDKYIKINSILVINII